MNRAMAAGAAAGLASAAFAQPVVVALDMDCAQAGVQRDIAVPPGTTRVCAAVYIYDPVGTRRVLSIGYIGALDRGIALGHSPPGNPSLQPNGRVTAIAAATGAPATAGGTGWVFPAMDKGFIGPEVQYLESGALQPSLLPAGPTAPIFTAEITLSNATAEDAFSIALMDFVSVWRGGTGGAFTTSATTWLDTGGDVTPDLTPGWSGLDPDVPVPVPPGAFAVDFVDGVTRPSKIIVTGCYANCDMSSQSPVLNVADFTCFLAKYAAGDPYANCDKGQAPPPLNVADFTCFLTKFAAGCL